MANNQDPAQLMKMALNSADICNRHLLNLLLSLDRESVDNILRDNPVFYNGCPRDINETEECYKQDRYNAAIDVISKAHSHVLEVKRLLHNLGIDYVRVKVGERFPQ